MPSRQRFRNRRLGIILPLIAVLAVFIMAIVVFFVDVAYMQLSRTQLQVATDASAKAACEALDAGLSENEVKQVAIDVAEALVQIASGTILCRSSAAQRQHGDGGRAKQKFDVQFHSILPDIQTSFSD